MSVRKSLAWSYGGQAINFVVTFGSSIVIARLLSPNDMGVFAIALAASAILSTLTSFSVHAYIVREGQLSPTLVRSIFTVNAILSTFLFLFTLALGMLGNHVFGEPEVGAVLMLMSLGPLLALFEFVPSALYMREMNYSVLSTVGVIRTVIAAVVSVASAHAGFGPMSLAIGPLVAGIFSVTFYNISRRRDVVLRPSFRGIRPVITFGLQMMSISGVAQISSRVSDIILGGMLGLTALGLYSRASNLANLIFSNVYGQATSVIFVKLSNDFREKGSVHETFVRSMQLITAVIWPLLIGLAILARPAIKILYGERWLDAALPLSFLMIAQFIVLGFGMNWELFVLRKETRLQTRYEFLRAVAGLLIFAVGCLHSISAAALGRVAEALVGYILYRPHMRRLSGAKQGEIEQVFLESAMLTISAAWPSLLLMLWNDWSADTSPMLVAIAVLLGVFCWCSLLLMRKHPLVDEVILLISRFREQQSKTPVP